MAMNFDLNDLLAFRALADFGNFSRAAESIHISQPAFSRRIEKLESALNTKLIERTTRHVSLTAVGRDFDRQLRHILNALDTTLLGIRGVAATHHGEITVACVPSAVHYFLSGVIKKFHEHYPRIRVKIIDDTASNVLSAVTRSEADFGLNFIGSQETDVDFQTLLDERFVAACRRDHPIANMKQVRWSELSQYDYMSVSKESGNRLLLDQALAGLPDRPTSLYETQHGTTMIGLVEAGLGVAVVPAMAMPASDHPLLVSVPLIEPTVRRKVGLIKRKGTVLTPAAQHLYDLCVQTQASKLKRTTAAANSTKEIRKRRKPVTGSTLGQ